jgi:phosphoribosylamine-glycine ligase
VEGEPQFAYVLLESKKKLAGDLGEFSGCAFDFVMTVPVDCRLIRESLGKLFPAYRQMRFTGFADANLIVGDKDLWFLEKCERFGYNSHPNLLWNLNRDPLAETLVGLVDGTFEPHFTSDIGASVRLYVDHPASGKLIRFPKEYDSHLYMWDVYRDGDRLLTAGYSSDVMIVTAAGADLERAWQELMVRAEAVKFQHKSYRCDGTGTDYPSSPIVRLGHLRTHGFI